LIVHQKIKDSCCCLLSDEIDRGEWRTKKAVFNITSPLKNYPPPILSSKNIFVKFIKLCRRTAPSADRLNSKGNYPWAFTHNKKFNFYFYLTKSGQTPISCNRMHHRLGLFIGVSASPLNMIFALVIQHAGETCSFKTKSSPNHFPLHTTIFSLPLLYTSFSTPFEYEVSLVVSRRIRRYCSLAIVARCLHH